MARPDVDFNKYKQVLSLHTGDIIVLTSGEKVVFERCKQKDFVGTMDNGKKYSIFINKFDKLIGKDTTTLISAAKTNLNPEIDDKEYLVRQLNVGDKIKLTNGEVTEFIKVNRTRFQGKLKGEVYNIPFRMFDSVVDKNTSISAFTKEKSKYEIYTMDKETRWYWNGRNFTDNGEESAIYSISYSKEYVKNNFLELPVVKKIFEKYRKMTKDELKIDVY